ncbi:Similar to Smim14: Small integral membrane protein 14 (Rattus norvegicus) [Cotesia congregata]|uniref:Small integral membrane protein 14 n=1 Tax=Cotesia congregata TaxID=51543 RepID=A0A8J2HBT4_COTCN|nr:Similar to Smim14: Small integral membrane protein 14 (Rattus norvegicus) [Cotesia congregata]
MADESFDVCECIWNHNAMQRLLSLLRQSQAACTDNECFNLTNLPGPEGGQQNSDFLFIGIAFVAMTLMYLFRPNSLRQSYADNVKPRNSTGPNDDPPAPPPIN